MDDTEEAIRAGLTEAEIAEAIREPMTIHLLSAVDIVGTIAALRAELATAQSHGASGDVALACRAAEVAELRAELATARAEINDILPELDAARSMGTQLERELATRTEELAGARKALWLTWVNGHDFNFNAQDKKMIDAQLDLAALGAK